MSVGEWDEGKDGGMACIQEKTETGLMTETEYGPEAFFSRSLVPSSFPFCSFKNSSSSDSFSIFLVLFDDEEDNDLVLMIFSSFISEIGILAESMEPRSIIHPVTNSIVRWN